MWSLHKKLTSEKSVPLAVEGCRRISQNIESSNSTIRVIRERRVVDDFTALLNAPPAVARATVASAIVGATGSNTLPYKQII